MLPSSLPCTFRPSCSDRDLLIEFSTHFPRSIKMASSSNNPARPNIYSTLSQESLNNLRINAGIPDSYELCLPGPTDVPYSPPSGFACFFVEQLEAGLRFPVPDLICRISRSYGIPLTQLVPNSIRLLISFSMILQHSQEVPTPQLWRTFYQAKTSSTPGFFYFTSRGLAKFIDGTPSSNKYWKKRFFYISSPEPWPFATRWIDDLPHQGRGVKPTPATLDLVRRLNSDPYHAQLLVESWPLLYYFRLSPKAVDLPGDLARAADARKSSGQPIHPEGEGHIPLTSTPREQVPPAPHTLAASTQSPRRQASRSPSPPAADLIRQRKRSHAASSSGAFHPIRPRLNLADLPTGEGDSPLNIMVPELNATWVENLVTPVHQRALGNADIQVRIRDMAHHASRGRSAGYEAGQAEWQQEKEKYLASDEFLDQVADAALPYLEQGMIIMAKRAQAKGLTLEVPDLKEAIKELPDASEPAANPSGGAPSSSASALAQPSALQVQPLTTHPSLETLSSDSEGTPDPSAANVQGNVAP
ncbi:hypothetical protein DH2020_008607 [Rehmannia glutinosa]|uniref:Transposase (putative) gypsy type domain-containing protein n=1 Tax=Rehmannia glutinosa TaxID=99300 RepID=A0ABR0X4J7_REHGL